MRDKVQVGVVVFWEFCSDFRSLRMRFRQHRGPDGLGSPCTDGGRLPGIKFFPSGKKRSVLILAQQYGIEVIRGWACGVRMLSGRRAPVKASKEDRMRISLW